MAVVVVLVVVVVNDAEIKIPKHHTTPIRELVESSVVQKTVWKS